MSALVEAPKCNCGTAMRHCATGSAECWHCDGCDGHHLCGSDRGSVASCAACVAAIRAKIADRLYPCSPVCPGWAVFNAETDPVLQICDECWAQAPEFACLTDWDLDLLPEAAHELALAVEDGAGYEPPAVRDVPCVCGCAVAHLTGDHAHFACSGCGAVSSAPAPKGDSILSAVMAAMQRAEEIGGPEGDDYLSLMKTIEDEARTRQETYRATKAAKELKDG